MTGVKRERFLQDMALASSYTAATLVIIKAIDEGKLKKSDDPTATAKFLNKEAKKIIKRYEFKR